MYYAHNFWKFRRPGVVRIDEREGRLPFSQIMAALRARYPEFFGSRQE